MKIYTYTPGKSMGSSAVYFQISSTEATLSSPVYENVVACEAAIKALVLRLRATPKNGHDFIQHTPAGYQLRLWGEVQPLANGHVFADKEKAQAILANLRTHSQAETILVTRYELAPDDQPASRSLNKPIPQQQEGTATAIDNDYLNRPSVTGTPDFERFTAVVAGAEQYFFHVNDEAGLALLCSKGYQSAANRDRGLQVVVRNLGHRDQFHLETADDQYFFVLHAKNNQEIARSRTFYSKATLNDAIDWLQAQAPTWIFQYLTGCHWRKTGDATLRFADNTRAPAPDPVPDPIPDPVPYPLPDPVPDPIPEPFPKPAPEPEPFPLPDPVPDPIPDPVPGPTPNPVPPVYPPLPVVKDLPKPAARSPCAPIFPLLQPFGLADLDLFFGRDEAVAALYEKTFDTRLLVVHGAQGVGKTSLLQCGLVNRIPAHRREMVYIRRQGNINDTLARTLRQAAAAAGSEAVLADCTARDALAQLYQFGFKPVLLIFDQLEELLAAPNAVAEQRQFFGFLQELLADLSFPAKVILVVREQYLAQLSDFEELVPTLFDHRYHVQPLAQDAVSPVVGGLLNGLASRGSIGLDQPALVARKVYDQLTARSPVVGLSCLQIYLHQLHQQVCTKTPAGPPVFSPGLINQAGTAEELIQSYLGNRITELEKQLPTDQSPALTNTAAQEIEDLVQLQNQCGCTDTPTRSYWLWQWFRRGQRTRWLSLLMLLSLFGFLGSAGSLFYTFIWLKKQTPCEITRQANTCEAYLNYLFKYGQNSDCAAEFGERLDLLDCPAWQDYQLAITLNTCAGYWSYIERYQNTALHLESFYQQVTALGCASRTNTVYHIDTLRDTIYKTRYVEVGIPADYDEKDSIPPSLCKDINGIPTLTLGPLWMMTNDLNGGTQYDWVNALSACRELGPGWRLPCVGEIEFILDKHYSHQKDPTNAYLHLSQGECPIAIRGQFWTATEATDQAGWSILFDSDDETIRLIATTDKKTALPCRCVTRDVTADSGMMECLEKDVYRKRYR